MTDRGWVALDRDGTIIQEHHYLSNPEEVELIPGAAEGLSKMQAIGLALVVVTNQSGINRGYFDLGRLKLIHQRLGELLSIEGVHLSGVYFCPHRPEDGCRCRKPETGMLESAAQDLDLNPLECVVIGDKASDIEMGRRIGATTLLVRTGYGTQVDMDGTSNPDFVVENLLEAAEVTKRLISRKEN